MARILLIDSLVAPCTNIASMLRAIDHTVECAFNGASAIDHLKACCTDVVVLDVAMQHLDGWQVLQWLSGHRLERKMSVIIHSALADTDWELAKNLGADELWVRGTCSFNSMCDSVDELLSNKKLPELPRYGSSRFPAMPRLGSRLGATPTLHC